MRRRVSLLLCVLLAGVLAAACVPAQRRVSFSVFGDPAELAAYTALVAAFEDANPQIDVTLNHIPDQAEYRQRLTTAFAAGNPPDVFLLNYRRVVALAAAGALTPLGDLLDGRAALAPAAFFPAALDAFNWQDQLWCIPQNVSSLVVYYNRTLFEAAGVPLPHSDWTRADFVAAAQMLTVDADGDGRPEQYGAGIEPGLYRLAPFVWQNGGEIVDDVVRPTRLALDTPAAGAALDWLVSLQTTYGVVPDLAAEAARPAEQRFLDGTLAIYFNSRRAVPTYRTITAFDWDVAPLPAGAQPAGILHSDGYCLAASAADPQAARQFIAFANSEAGQTLVARSGRTVPSLRAVAASDAFLDPTQPPANSRVFIDTLPVLRAVPLLPNWVAIEETASAEIERAFYGDLAVDAAIQRAIDATTPLFSP